MKVWYAAYASNMLKRRFMLYLEGGIMPETGRDHKGARNPSPPERDESLWLPGTVYFATESKTWPGTGRALYDSYDRSRSSSAGRGYLIDHEQFLDVVAQEMQLEPGWIKESKIPVASGERVRLGDGHYETLVCTGRIDGYPVVTMAAPWNWQSVPLVPLCGPYRDVIREGLKETFGWGIKLTEEYLSTLPGGEYEHS